MCYAGKRPWCYLLSWSSAHPPLKHWSHIWLSPPWSKLWDSTEKHSEWTQSFALKSWHINTEPSQTMWWRSVCLSESNGKTLLYSSDINWMVKRQTLSVRFHAVTDASHKKKRGKSVDFDVEIPETTCQSTTTRQHRNSNYSSDMWTTQQTQWMFELLECLILSCVCSCSISICFRSEPFLPRWLCFCLISFESSCRMF